MFNFFKKQTQEIINKEENYDASISYKSKDNGSIIIDIEIQDFNEKSMESLFSIIDVLYDDKTATETTNTLYQHLINNNQKMWADALIQYTAEILINKANKKILEENSVKPYIKPSEILK